MKLVFSFKFVVRQKSQQQASFGVRGGERLILRIFLPPGVDLCHF